MISKNKKGFLLIPWIPIFLLLGAVLLFLLMLVIFAPRIAMITTPIFDFFTKWWWSIALFITGIVYAKQLGAVFNAILKWVGIKV